MEFWTFELPDARLVAAWPSRNIRSRVLCRFCCPEQNLLCQVFSDEEEKLQWELRRWWHRNPVLKGMALYHRCRNSQDVPQPKFQIPKAMSAHCQHG